MLVLTVTILALIGFVWFRPSLMRDPVGKILVFLALFILPVMATLLGLSVQLEHSKSTEFCLSCHPMEPYGTSLRIKDPDYLPASHFQNKRILQERACFACHTQYTMFGDLNSKLRGLKHVYVQYLGTVPERIELYTPFHNRECLYCHVQARSFEENEAHQGMEEQLSDNEVSCLDCHAMTHAVEELEELELWNPPTQ